VNIVNIYKPYIYIYIYIYIYPGTSMSFRHHYEYKFPFVGGKIKNGVGQTCILV